VVSLADAWRGGLSWRDSGVYVVAQLFGGLAGAATANTMFAEPVFFASRQARQGGAQLFSEFVATFGLLAVIWGCAKLRSGAVAFAVGGYISAAYWFTASTSFANPAVTVARAASDTFTGIRPIDVPGFTVAQVFGAAAATALFAWLAGEPLGRRQEAMTTQVIFACVHNAGRSQMAAAFFNALADPTRARALSAGTEPGDRVHPEVVDVMREVGIDLSRATPARLTDELVARGHLLVTMGCGEACPVAPGLERDDWPIEDPKGGPPDRVRRIRDEVRGRVARLITARGWARAPGA
jgi:arsenate reductase